MTTREDMLNRECRRCFHAYRVHGREGCEECAACPAFETPPLPGQLDERRTIAAERRAVAQEAAARALVAIGLALLSRHPSQGMEEQAEDAVVLLFPLMEDMLVRPAPSGAAADAGGRDAG